MKSHLLVALIFAALVAAVVSALAWVFAAAAAPSPLWMSIAMALTALFLLDALVLHRIYKMYKAADSGDVAALKSLNSVGWAVVALLFAGLIPGIMLILIHGLVEKL